jgi:uncharacterized protein YndB with AHSA1/START domain
MKKSASGKRTAGIGDEAVARATGKTWAQWLKVLDAAGARKMAHRDIATLLNKKHKVSGWWSQMVTVGYEQARGLRAVHQKASGFSASASKTVDAPFARLYKAWADQKARAAWLGRHSLTIRKATPNKSLRITWGDGTNVDVNFYAKGAAKSQVAVEHDKLPNAAAVSKSKALWGKALASLKARLER